MDDSETRPYAPEITTAEPSRGEPGAASLLEGPSQHHAGATRGNSPPRVEGVVIGQVAAVGPGGPLVSFPGSPVGGKMLAALATVAVSERDVGRDVALVCQEGDPRRPVVIGFIHRPDEPREAAAASCGSLRLEVSLDGKSVTLTADERITLRCGEASVTLTRAGKILVRGAYVSSHSTGVNRIRGGSVQIN